MPTLGHVYKMLLPAAIALPLMVYGCAKPKAPAVQSAVSAAHFDKTYDAAIAVLTKRGFVIERRDHRFGVVETEPHGSGTIAEPWRPNNVNLGTALNATLNDQRRTVTVTLQPSTQESDADKQAEPGWYDLDVQVLVERRQTPDRRVGGAPSGQVFTQYASTPVELTRRGIEGTFWQPVGRDVALEQAITREIIAAHD